MSDISWGCILHICINYHVLKTQHHSLILKLNQLKMPLSNMSCWLCVDNRSLSLLIVTDASHFIHLHNNRQKGMLKKERGCPLLLIGSLCLPWSRRSSVTFMPKKTSAPAAPSPGFSIPSLSLKILFFCSICFFPQPTATLPPCLFSHFDCMHLSLDSSG